MHDGGRISDGSALTISGNGVNGVRYRDRTVSSTETWKNIGIPYYPDGSVNVAGGLASSDPRAGTHGEVQVGQRAILGGQRESRPTSRRRKTEPADSHLHGPDHCYSGVLGWRRDLRRRDAQPAVVRDGRAGAI